MVFESGFSTTVVAWVKIEDQTCCTVRHPGSPCWSLLLPGRAAPDPWGGGTFFIGHQAMLEGVHVLGHRGGLAVCLSGGWQQLLLCQQQLMM